MKTLREIWQEQRDLLVSVVVQENDEMDPMLLEMVHSTFYAGMSSLLQELESLEGTGRLTLALERQRIFQRWDQELRTTATIMRMVVETPEPGERD